MTKSYRILLTIIWLLLMYSVFCNMILDAKVSKLKDENIKLKTELHEYKKLK